jgi:hypothetical protein
MSDLVKAINNNKNICVVISTVELSIGEIAGGKVEPEVQ